jgi:hypothetical protein
MWMVHVASLWRLRGVEAEDGRVDARAASDPSTPTLAFLCIRP